MVVAGGAVLLVGLTTLELPILSGHRFLLGAIALGNLTAAAGCAFAVVLIWRAWKEPAARALAVLLVATALLYLLAVLPLAFAGRAAGELLGYDAPAARAFWSAVAVLVAVAGAALLRFAAFFPDEVTEQEIAVVRARGEEGARELPGLLRILSTLGWKLRKDERVPRFLRPTAALEFRLSRLFLTLARSHALWPGAILLGLSALVSFWMVPPLLFVVTVTSLTGATAFLTTSYMTSDATGRRKILWFTAGAFPCLWLMSVGGGMAMVLVADLLLGEAPLPEILAVLLVITSPAGLVLMAALAAAVFLHGALDPALTIRRTVLYSSLGVLLAFLFAVLENGLSDWLLEGTRLPFGAGAWIAGGMLAVAVVPLHRWTERGVDRILDGRLPDTEPPRYDGADAVLVRVERTPGSAGGDDGRAVAVVLETAALKAANRHGGHSASGGGEEGATLLFERPDGAIRATLDLLRNVRSACDALDLDPGDLRATIHRGRVEVGAGGVAGPALEAATRAAAQWGRPGAVLVLDAVLEKRLAGDEAPGFDLEEVGRLEDAGEGEPVRVSRLTERVRR